jgi:hypothetical protein
LVLSQFWNIPDFFETPHYSSTMLKLISLVVALAGPSQAALRFACSTLSIQRLDPLVQPGVIPSAHVHQIVGGNNFRANMTTGDVSEGATCTTCTFSQDFSNYWTAVLYFKARNGTYKRVPLYPNADLTDGTQGGMVSQESLRFTKVAMQRLKPS